MAMRTRSLALTLVVLGVLLGNQVAYAAQALERPSGHCRAATPPPEERCPLPLWLPCCDDQAAVGTAHPGPEAPSPLVLPLEAVLPRLDPAGVAAEARRTAIPPDPPSRLSTVLLI
jgi:hypothetical protein